MPLDFTGIYKVSDINQNYIRVPQIGMAPRKVSVMLEDEPNPRDQYQFLVPNDVNLGHTIIGTIVQDDKTGVVIEDEDRVGDDGGTVLWRFEPLTRVLWDEMGSQGYISGWDELKLTLTDDESVLHFYNYDWLLTRLEWWKEEQESGREKPSAEPE